MERESTRAPVSPAPGPSPSAQELQVEDLHRRIETLESIDETLLGEFTRVDWALCIAGAVVIPTLVLLWVGR